VAISRAVYLLALEDAVLMDYIDGFIMPVPKDQFAA